MLYLQVLDMNEEHYRAKAMDCLTVAKRAREPGERLELLSIARGFLRLATHAGRERTEAAGFRQQESTVFASPLRPHDLPRDGR